MVDTPALSHVDKEGHVQMVDVAHKPDTVRTAVAAGRVMLGKEAFDLIAAGQLRKGDALTAAQIAGIQAAKQTSTLLPLCHSVFLQGVDIQFDLDEERNSIEIRAITKSIGPTGVEMEALAAVTIAALTVYDMCKSVSKELKVTDIRLLAKTGGQSGDYRRSESS